MEQGRPNMLTVNLDDFQNRVLELIHQAAAGEPVVIAQADRPLVKVVPYAPPQALERLDFMRDQCVIPEDIKSVAREEIIALFEGQE
jgi:prevent-host-death family protein